MFTVKFLKNHNLKAIFLSFLSWRIYLILIVFLATNFIPLAGKNFFGGGLENYLAKPWFFGWANFDGEHYLSIANFGYKDLEQAFFPIYPLLMRILASPFEINFTTLTLSGLVISNLAFLISLFVLFKLIKLDYPSNIGYLTIMCILVFPYSFYFGALYSESIFLLLSISAFYFARIGNWKLATLLGIIASTTRVFGFLLLPAFLLEAMQQKEKISKFWWIFLIPLGILGYMYYQFLTVGDPLAFYNLQRIIGEHHQSGIVTLPQVYFRYLKILLTLPFSNPFFLTALLEFIVGILFLILPIVGFFKKVRWSYLFYTLAGFLLPTVQGSLSSVPRYVIVFFPAFLIIALVINKSPKLLKIFLFIISLFLLSLETALFLRGYWIA